MHFLGQRPLCSSKLRQLEKSLVDHLPLGQDLLKSVIKGHLKKFDDPYQSCNFSMNVVTVQFLNVCFYLISLPVFVVLVLLRDLSPKYFIQSPFPIVKLAYWLSFINHLFNHHFVITHLISIPNVLSILKLVRR